MTELLSQRIFFSLHRNGKLNLYNAQNIIHILLDCIFCKSYFISEYLGLTEWATSLQV